MLRLAQSFDLPFIYWLYMHPSCNSWLLYEEMDEANFQPIYYDLISRDLIYIFEKEEKPKGMVKLVPQKFRNSHIIYLGGVAIDPSYSGMGLGEEMLQEAIGFVRSKGYKRVELTVATMNKRAISLYEKLGFINEGLLRNYTYLAKEGRYIDELVMGLLL